MLFATTFSRVRTTMFSIQRIVFMDRRAFMCALCVVFIFIVFDIHTRSYLTRRNVYSMKKLNGRDLQVFAVFLILPSLASEQRNKSLDVGQISERYFKLPNCSIVKSFRLYLLMYSDAPTMHTKDSVLHHLNGSFEHCERHVPIVVEDLLIKDRSVDGRFLRGVILEAYLDNVDYYGIVLADGMTEKGEREVDLSQWKDILLKRSPRGVGVVTSMNTKEIGAVSKLFFSKVHIEIFGAAFPLRISKLESALSYTVWLYSSKQMATIDAGTNINTDIQTALAERATATKLTDQQTEDYATLNRYLSAVEASQESWRSISSTRNVISMSLYGDNRRYTFGALRNAQLFPVTFPGWRLWFYCEKPLPDGSVRYGKIPEKILRKVVDLGAEIQYVDTAATGLAPMLWRFLVAEDLDVDAFQVRDCDSRLTLRDAIVVGEWLKTNASFHCIRDHPSHSHFPVSGGLWGGRPRLLYSILNGTMRSLMKRYGAGYLADMNFLGADVWPKVKDFAFCHDSFSCKSFPSSHPFPVKRIGFEHLGQVYDENSIGRQGDINILASARVNAKCVPSA